MASIVRRVYSATNLLNQFIDESSMFGSCIRERGLKLLNRRISIALLPPSSLIVSHSAGEDAQERPMAARTGMEAEYLAVVEQAITFVRQ